MFDLQEKPQDVIEVFSYFRISVSSVLQTLNFSAGRADFRRRAARCWVRPALGATASGSAMQDGPLQLVTIPPYGNRLDQFLPCCEIFPARECANGVDRDTASLWSTQIECLAPSEIRQQVRLLWNPYIISHRTNWNMPSLPHCPRQWHTSVPASPGCGTHKSS